MLDFLVNGADDPGRIVAVRVILHGQHDLNSVQFEAMRPAGIGSDERNLETRRGHHGPVVTLGPGKVEVVHAIRTWPGPSPLWRASSEGKLR